MFKGCLQINACTGSVIQWTRNFNKTQQAKPSALWTISSSLCVHFNMQFELTALYAVTHDFVNLKWEFKQIRIFKIDST